MAVRCREEKWESRVFIDSTEPCKEVPTTYMPSVHFESNKQTKSIYQLLGEKMDYHSLQILLGKQESAIPVQREKFLYAQLWVLTIIQSHQVFPETSTKETS